MKLASALLFLFLDILFSITVAVLISLPLYILASFFMGLHEQLRLITQPWGGEGAESVEELQDEPSKHASYTVAG